MDNESTADRIPKLLTELFQNVANTKAVIGEPIHIGEVIIIPVIRVTIGVGSGGGGEEEKEKKFLQASLGGTSVEPVAFLVVTKDKVQLLNMGREAVVEHILEKVPGVVENIAKMVQSPKK